MPTPISCNTSPIFHANISARVEIEHTSHHTVTGTAILHHHHLLTHHNLILPHKPTTINHLCQHPQLHEHLVVAIALDNVCLRHSLPQIALRIALAKSDALKRLRIIPPRRQQLLIPRFRNILTERRGTVRCASVQALGVSLVVELEIIGFTEAKRVDQELECARFRAVVQVGAGVELGEGLGLVLLDVLEARRRVGGAVLGVVFDKRPGRGFLGGCRTGLLVRLSVRLLAVTAAVLGGLAFGAGFEGNICLLAIGAAAC